MCKTKRALSPLRRVLIKPIKVKRSVTHVSDRYERWKPNAIRKDSVLIFLFLDTNEIVRERKVL